MDGRDSRGDSGLAARVVWTSASRLAAAVVALPNCTRSHRGIRGLSGGSSCSRPGGLAPCSPERRRIKRGPLRAVTLQRPPLAGVWRSRKCPELRPGRCSARRWGALGCGGLPRGSVRGTCVGGSRRRYCRMGFLALPNSVVARSDFSLVGPRRARASGADPRVAAASMARRGIPAGDGRSRPRLQKSGGDPSPSRPRSRRVGHRDCSAQAVGI